MTVYMHAWLYVRRILVGWWDWGKKEEREKEMDDSYMYDRWLDLFQGMYQGNIMVAPPVLQRVLLNENQLLRFKPVVYSLEDVSVTNAAIYTPNWACGRVAVRLEKSLCALLKIGLL